MRDRDIIRGLSITAPVRCSQVLIKNFTGEAIMLIATREVGAL